MNYEIIFFVELGYGVRVLKIEGNMIIFIITDPVRQAHVEIYLRP